jgi:hypothetical protein
MTMRKLRTPITPIEHVVDGRRLRSRFWSMATMNAPHCGAAQPVVNQVLQTLSGQIRLVEAHPHDEIAAESAEFAGAACLFRRSSCSRNVSDSRKRAAECLGSRTVPAQGAQ